MGGCASVASEAAKKLPPPAEPGTPDARSAHSGSKKSSPSGSSEVDGKQSSKEQPGGFFRKHFPSARSEAEKPAGQEGSPAVTEEHWGIPPAKRYKLRDLQHATNNFDESQVLGKGSFGKVYKGVLDDVRVAGQGTGTFQRMDVAVKKLNPESFQGFDEWLNEVLLLEKLRHPNLVRLVGYCAEGGEGLLVYEYCPNGSLDQAFFSDDPERLRLFTWEQRVKIALDAAEGLNYLHEQNVIHRDYKPGNILLTAEMSARLTDFGMAKEGPEGKDSHVSTRIMGTLGYLDPSYMQTGRLTRKSDVYSFGVMLLELISGRQSKEENLTKWARPLLAGRKPNIEELIDERLEDRYSKAGAGKMAILARYCLDYDPVSRPEMKVMVESLMKISKET